MTDSATTPLLAVRGVSRRFGVVQALADVSLDIRAGEVLALVGENGAGKSTLMRVIEGVHPPDAGSIAVDGRAVAFRSPADAHAAGIRVIHQEPDICADLSIAENLFVGELSRIGGIFLDRRTLAQRTRAMLAQFGLERALSPWTRAGDLGAAHRQVLEIMRALRAGVRLLALDEPTSSLTEDEARRLFGVIRRLRGDGVAVIYISHRMHEVRALADRVAVLRDGRADGGPPRRRAGRGGDRAADGRTADRRSVRACPEAARAGGAVGRGAGHPQAARTSADRARRRGGRARPGWSAPDAPNWRRRSSAPIGRSPAASRLGRHADPPAQPGRRDRGRHRLRAGGTQIAGAAAAAQRRGQRDAVRARSGQPLGVLDRMRDRASPASRWSGCASRRRASTSRSRNSRAAISRRWCSAAGWPARPRVLILDEPTRGIDVGAKAEIYRLIAELAAPAWRCW